MNVTFCREKSHCHLCHCLQGHALGRMLLAHVPRAQRAAEAHHLSLFVQHMQRERLPERGILKLARDSKWGPGKADPNVLLDSKVWEAIQQPAALNTLGELICLPALRTGA